MPADHPQDDVLLALLEGRLDDGELARVSDHLAVCDDCRALIAHAASSGGAFEELPIPERIGRYEIHEPLGEGAMGVVRVAYDPQLDRRVAIKLLRSDASGEHDRPERLLREAKAMAKVAHPNVVHVYDAGIVDDRVFLVMELVQGPTLARWVAEAPRSWREVTAAFIEAGLGLRAAHEAGIVHRDFKPQNVLMGRDGRPRVTDFGVARPDDDAPSDAAAPSSRSLLATLTATGTVLGTPAYMAPEQFARRRADARTDEFSFCVALYESVYGSRPFGSGLLADLARRVLEGDIEPAPPLTPVPPRLRAILLRGLSTRPADRYPTMAALLEDLGQVIAAKAGPRRRIVPLVAGGAALVVLVPLAVALWSSRARSSDAPAETARATSSSDPTPSPTDAATQATMATALPAAISSEPWKVPPVASASTTPTRRAPGVRSPRSRAAPVDDAALKKPF